MYRDFALEWYFGKQTRLQWKEPRRLFKIVGETCKSKQNAAVTIFWAELQNRKRRHAQSANTF